MLFCYQRGKGCCYLLMMRKMPVLRLPGLALVSLLLLLFLVTGTRCQVRKVRLEIIPEIVEYGQEAVLRCNYELEKNNDTKLYIVKWWSHSPVSTGEFYRYSPGEPEKIKIFNKDLLEVNPLNSNESQVAIKNVPFQLKGNFSCEVTTDAPLFSTLSSSKFLNVVSIPKVKPVIKTERERYERGDTLEATCSVPPSKPSADIYFTINSHRVSSSKSLDKRKKNKHNSVQEIVDEYELPRERQMRNLHLVLKPEHFSHGVVLLGCHVKIDSIYADFKEIQLGGRIKEPVPAREFIYVPVTLNKGVSCHEIADLTLLLLTVAIHLYLR